MARTEPPDAGATVELLRRRGDAIIGRELTRLAGRARALGPRDLAVVEDALNELVERLVLARLRAVPHRAAEVGRLFADPDELPAPPAHRPVALHPLRR
ncbi:hypothetical protein [Jiangella rhizosphaerae]|uniref:Tetrapyrrole biosynthesis glutamyl-tRNA reductase dimerisation domain-containing protein n=1 Tax=Jiangella rhizosphaerae TaxID=2293569 RepID=A0A418KL79_9ACTN|nr:hypothetical protein [Jiangella rhizosphaerae]RIQ18289.1 hypothetical protein DY240_22000 [Jiangella rhizosphaerae]